MAENGRSRGKIIDSFKDGYRQDGGIKYLDKKTISSQSGGYDVYSRRLSERDAMNRYSDDSLSYAICNHQYTLKTENYAELSELVYDRYALTDWSEGKSPTVVASETYYLTFTTPEKGLYKYEYVSSGKVTMTGQGSFQVEKVK